MHLFVRVILVFWVSRSATTFVVDILQMAPSALAGEGVQGEPFRLRNKWNDWTRPEWLQVFMEKVVCQM